MDTTPFDPIFVTGLPRSHTSMTAGLLHQAGAWVGDTIPGDDNNPKGYFENMYIREKIVKAELGRRGCDKLGIRAIPPFDIDMTIDLLDERIYAALASQGYPGGPWLYKDAKLTLLWPAFANEFPKANWVIVRRDVDSLIDSCMKTSFMRQHSTNRNFWRNIAADYNDRLDKLFESDNNVYELHTPQLLRGKGKELRELIEALGLNFDAEKIKRFINPKLSRSQR